MKPKPLSTLKALTEPPTLPGGGGASPIAGPAAGCALGLGLGLGGYLRVGATRHHARHHARLLHALHLHAERCRRSAGAGAEVLAARGRRHAERRLGLGRGHRPVGVEVGAADLVRVGVRVGVRARVRARVGVRVRARAGVMARVRARARVRVRVGVAVRLTCLAMGLEG
eukprot:scaffold94143_cov38-Phaeocystis_antarctica.AAC.2